ncbi:MAG: ABC transporter permease [Armatimonadetes bacterium]|nr:ABC transporter permease [Armatimonadota bacterium]
MRRYLARRLLGTVGVLLGVAAITFLIMRLLPGDVAQMLLSEWGASAEQVKTLRRQLGQDEPLHPQFARFLWRAAQGDLGRSIHTHRAVVQEIVSQFSSTLQLTLAGLIIGVGLGIVLGVLAAFRENTWVDGVSMGLALLGVCIPNYWLGLVMIYIFSLRLGWFPAIGVGGWERLVLPAMVLGIGVAAVIARLTRSSLLEILRQEYIVTARAKGLPQRIVLLRHALRNALIPVVAIVGLNFGNLLSGAVVIETVFSRQGLGRLTITAILGKDFTLVQGTVLFSALVYAVTNLLVDLTYAVIDPRITYG